MMKAVPDVFVDTSGYAFTFPLFKMFGKCKVGCYIHYPTISTDMLSQVKSRTATYNNKSRISNSWLLSYLKLRYYKVILKVLNPLLLKSLKNKNSSNAHYLFSSYLPSYIVKPESIQT